jgi:hypothetical protein
MDLDDAESRTRALIAKHLPRTRWRFAWYEGIQCAGICTNEGGRYRVKLSRKITRVTPWRYVHTTILHEIAHALTWRERKAHGPRWVAKCLELGLAPHEVMTPAEMRLHAKAQRKNRRQP